LQVTAHRLADPPNTFAVDVDAANLSVREQAEGGLEAEVTLMIASFNRQNKMIAHRIQETTAWVAPRAASTPSAEFRIQAEIPADATRVRVIARDAASGKMGTADLDPAEFRAR
jgi:hypothetical protein